MRWQDILQKAPPFDLRAREGGIEQARKEAREKASAAIEPWAEQFIDEALEAEVESQEGVGPYIIQIDAGEGLEELNDIIFSLGGLDSGVDITETKLKQEYNAQEVIISSEGSQPPAPERKKKFSPFQTYQKRPHVPLDPSGDTTNGHSIPTRYEISFDMKEVI